MLDDATIAGAARALNAAEKSRARHAQLAPGEVVGRGLDRSLHLVVDGIGESGAGRRIDSIEAAPIVHAEVAMQTT